MKTYTLHGLAQALTDVGIGEGDTVMMHSSLLALGRLDGHESDELVPAVAGRLLEHLGPRGTLVVPTFTYSFAGGRPYDRQNSPAELMGQLSEYVRVLPDAERSAHPMQSVAAVGSLAGRICRGDTPSAFNRDGAFASLVDVGATLLTLGLSLEAASLVHLAEQWADVPYRYWKEFSGECVDAGVSRTCTCRMYVRDLDLDPQITVAPIESELRRRGEVLETSLGAGRLTTCRFPDFVTTALDLLGGDPMCLVRTTGAS